MNSLPQKLRETAPFFGRFILLGLFVCIGSGVAKAGCGDYLMPLHEAVHASDADLEHGRMRDGFPENKPVAPCDGPGCGQAPEAPAAGFAVQVVVRSNVVAAAMLGSRSCSAQVPDYRYLMIVVDDRVEREVTSRLFRPPRV